MLHSLPATRRLGWRVSVSVGGGEGRRRVARDRWIRQRHGCSHALSDRAMRLQKQAAYRYWRNPERFLASAPHIGHNLKQLSEFLMEHIAHLLNSVKHKREQLTAKISCHLAITEYRGTKYDMESSMESIMDIPAPKHNQMNFDFTLNLQEQDLPMDETAAKKFQNKMLGEASRRSSSLSMVNNQNETSVVDEDTFEHIMQVTAHNDALMAFYYTDENNKVKVTEIFDVTEAETGALLCPDEREANTNLEFDDNEWNLSPSNSDPWNGLSRLEDEECEDDQVSVAGSDVSLQESLDMGSSTNVFSDPESEWLPSKPGLQPLQPEKLFPDDSRPESDQPAASDMPKRRVSAATLASL